LVSSRRILRVAAEPSAAPVVWSVLPSQSSSTHFHNPSRTATSAKRNKKKTVSGNSFATYICLLYLQFGSVADDVQQRSSRQVKTVVQVEVGQLTHPLFLHRNRLHVGNDQSIRGKAGQVGRQLKNVAEVVVETLRK